MAKPTGEEIRKLVHANKSIPVSTPKPTGEEIRKAVRGYKSSFQIDDNYINKLQDDENSLLNDIYSRKRHVQRLERDLANERSKVWKDYENYSALGMQKEAQEKLTRYNEILSRKLDVQKPLKDLEYKYNQAKTVRQTATSSMQADFQELLNKGKSMPENKLVNFKPDIETPFGDVDWQKGVVKVGRGNDAKYTLQVEKDTYSYILAKEGKDAADAYLKGLEDVINARAGKKQFEDIQALPGWVREPTKAAFGLGAGIEQGVTGIGGMFTDTPRAVSPTQYASSMIQEDPNISPLGKVGYQISYSVGNMLPSILLSSATGVPGLGTAMMGLSAAGSAKEQALKEGMDPDKATGYGLLIGASEGTLQYLLGGITKLGGLATKGVVAKTLSNIDNALVKTVATLGTSMFGEFSEEYLQEVLDPVFRNMVFDENNQVKLVSEEALYSGILGALTAGVLEGPSSIKSGVSSAKIGDSILKAGRYASLINQALNSTNADVVQLAEDLENGKLRPTKNVVGVLAKACYAVDNNPAFLFEQVDTELLNYDAVGGENYQKYNDGTPEYAEAYRSVYESAKEGLSYEEIVEKSDLAQNLNPEARQAAFAAGIRSTDEISTDTSKQKISSAATSINSNKLPAIFSKVKFKPGTVNLDIGGGRFDNATEFLKTQGVTNYIYDPYNRSEEHNKSVAQKTQGGKSDTVTVSNVLNVIQEQEARDEVLLNASRALKKDGTVYITVYEGNGTGESSETTKGWQENRLTNTYVNEVKKFFSDVEVKNKVIIAKNPVNTFSTSTNTETVERTTGSPTIDQYLEGQWKTTRVGKDPKKIKKLSEIVDELRYEFHVPISTGKTGNRNTLGFYRPRDRIIRSQSSNDLPTISHEIGHALDFSNQILNNMITKQLMPEIMELVSNTDMRHLQSYEQRLWAIESFAEYLRSYFLNSEETVKRFPKFSKYLFETIPPNQAKMLNQFADDINAIYSLDKKTASSSIVLKEGSGKSNVPFNDRMSDIATNVMFYNADRYSGIKRFSKEAGDNSYKFAVMSAYADGVARGALEGDLHDINGRRIAPGLKKVLKGIDLKNKTEYIDFGEYLINKHGIELIPREIDVYADREKNTIPWMENRIKELEKQYPKFKEVSEKLYDFQDTFGRVWGVNTGIIRADLFNRWRRESPNYVPLNRDIKNGPRGYGAKRGFSNQTSPVHRQKGSGLEIIHPVDNIMNNMTTMIQVAWYNSVMQRITESADTKQGLGWYIEKVNPDMRVTQVDINPILETILDKVKLSSMDMMEKIDLSMSILNASSLATQYSPMNPSGNIITVMRGGRASYYQINDKALLHSISNMNPPQSRDVLYHMGRITRFVSGNVTGRNLLWSIFKNPIKDFSTAFVYSTTKNPIKIILNIGRGYVNTFKGMKASPLFQEFKAMGMMQASAYTADKRMPKSVRQGTNWLNPLEWVDFVSNMIEAGPRFSEYKMIRENGGTPLEASYAAANITVNFRLSGVASKQINNFVPFYNPSVQGVTRFVKWLTADDLPKSQRKKAIVGRIAGMTFASAAIAAIMYALNSADDKAKENYKRLSNYTKNNYWCFPTDGEGHYYVVPKPRELAVMSSFFQALMEQEQNEDPFAYQEFGEYAVDQLLPNILNDVAKWDWKSAIGSISVIGPISYLTSNTDFLGKPIVGKYQEGLLPKDQYTELTSKAAKVIGDALGVSPIQVDYLFESFLGGFWKMQKSLFPINEEKADLSLGITNMLSKDNQYTNDIINNMYNYKAQFETEKNSNPEDGAAKAKFKFASLTTDFYSRYYSLDRNTPNNERNRATRETVLNMAYEFNKYAKFGYGSEMQEKLVKFTTDVEAYPDTMQVELTDDNKGKHKLSASKYVQYQVEYNTRYWEYVDQLLDGKPTVEQLKAAKLKAKEEVTAETLNSLGVKTKKYDELSAQRKANVSSLDMIKYSAIRAKENEDGSFKQEDMIKVLESMKLDTETKKYIFSTESDSLYSNVYLTADEINAEIKKQVKAGREVGSIKNSITGAYKDKLIDAYVRKDKKGIKEIVDKLSNLILTDNKGNQYYTIEKFNGWIQDYLDKIEKERAKKNG